MLLELGKSKVYIRLTNLCNESYKTDSVLNPWNQKLFSLVKGLSLFKDKFSGFRSIISPGWWLSKKTKTAEPFPILHRELKEN